MSATRANDFEHLENHWITLADGCRLAARLWLPVEATQRPVPAVLEFLPYRKRDGTSARDETTYPGYARAGIAGVRVDMRGNGESDGLMEDEYTPEELSDACEVIAWIAAQPWCNGAVGMMGISWGGFNALQVAALRPPALKAVISLATSVDRFNDDIHYKGGALLNSNLGWAATVMSNTSRPPDPELLGERWREVWLYRLENMPDLPRLWMSHQTRDALWQHGSICEDWSAIEVPVLVFGGWADGYRNAPAAALANLQSTVKAVVGPWVHKYPHMAWPYPRMDFVADSIAWWKHWLAGEGHAVETLPAYRAYITENVRPRHYRPRDPGRWVAESRWPSPGIEPRTLYLHATGSLGTEAGEAAELSVCSPQDCGTSCGEYFSTAPNGEMAGDQRADDAWSLLFQTAPLEESLELLGRPLLRLPVAIDAPTGNLIVRLEDVHPDGTSHRASWGVLNLAHRAGHEHPQAMTPGRSETVSVLLDEMGHRFLPGHRLRVAVSTTYWPLVLPPPSAVTATLTLGAEAALVLPVRVAGEDCDVPEPAGEPSVPVYKQLSPPVSRRWVERELNDAVTRYRLLDDTGEEELPEHGLRVRKVREENWQIERDDPLSSRARLDWTVYRARGDWRTRTEYRLEFSVDATHFHLQGHLLALEADLPVFERDWRESIPRNLN